jgi:Chs5-Arf1p-binding protein BUD7/BCH1
VRAYSLTRLISEIGWDELLKTRSAVFVMEEEYRMQKSQADLHSATGEGRFTLHEDGHEEGEDRDVGEVVIHENGTVVRQCDNGKEDEGLTLNTTP